MLARERGWRHNAGGQRAQANRGCALAALPAAGAAARGHGPGSGWLQVSVRFRAPCL